jgi:signal transduction histidine kinase
LQTSLDRQEQLMDELRRGKLAEAEAYSAQAAAEAASQAKSMFLATMSHELRTPLNAILGYAQLLRLTTPRRAPVEDAEAPDPLDRILAAGRHLTAVISDVLDFSKIEQGRLELNLTPVSLCGLAREALDVVQPLAERQHNRLLLRCDPELGSVLSDADKLRQVLLNLLSNAAKFTEHGEIVLRVWREAPAERGQRVRFAVSDTGIGIAPEQFGRLFQPFSQLDASVTRRYEGTGLGLALSRQICLALGGDISVISTPGRGSTFTVDLPAIPPQSLDQHETLAGDELLSATEHPLQPVVT